MTPKMRRYMQVNQPVTARQAARDLGLSRQGFCEYRSQMHITAWTVNARGQATALYVLGTGRDAIKPLPKSQSERGKAYRERHSAIIEARRPSKRTTTLGMWAQLL